MISVSSSRHEPTSRQFHSSAESFSAVWGGSKESGHLEAHGSRCLRHPHVACSHSLEECEGEVVVVFETEADPTSVRSLVGC